MRIPLGHLTVTVPEDLLHLVKGPTAVHQEGCIGMTQVMNAQPLHAGLGTQAAPDLVHVDQRLLGLGVDEQVVVLAFGAELTKHLKRGIVQRHRADAFTLAVAGRNFPDPCFLSI